MRATSRTLRQELKRLSASLEQLRAPPATAKSKKAFDPTRCLCCKQDAGRNFYLVYKRDHTLKGKICKACNDKSLQPSSNVTPSERAA